MTQEQRDDLDRALELGAVTPDFHAALINNVDAWIPANGGNETTYFSREHNARVLWCYNPAQSRHAYINVDLDMEVF